jgi:hypothetical protein
MGKDSRTRNEFYVRNVEMSNLEQEINSSIEKCSIYVCRSINNMHVG